LLNFVAHNCVAPGSFQSVFVSNRKSYREVQVGSDSCQAVCNQGVSFYFLFTDVITTQSRRSRLAS
jgi:hypothetical protein